MAILLRSAAVALVAPTLAGWPPARSGAQAGTCAEPYPPAFAAVTYPAPPIELPWAGGRELDHVPEPFDTDGDGAEDTIVDLPQNAVRITRSSGSITLPAHTFLPSRFDPADLDGDGRTDPVAGIPVDGTNAVFVVPGTAPDGPLDPAVDAIRVPDEIGGARPVGDQDGDGIVDLAASTATDGTGSTLVYSGAALTAPGAGGTAEVEPFLRLDGHLVGRIPFDPGPPTLVTLAGSDVVVHRDPAVRLTVTGTGVTLPAVTAGTTGAMGVVDGGTTWLVLGHGDRSGNRTWGWMLTDPCGTVTPEPTTPVPTPPVLTPSGPATRAAPVEAEVAYTG